MSFQSDAIVVAAFGYDGAHGAGIRPGTNRTC
jgi:hypothetical protein